jgi:hypothetical protein
MSVVGQRVAAAVVAGVGASIVFASGTQGEPKSRRVHLRTPPLSTVTNGSSPLGIEFARPLALSPRDDGSLAAVRQSSRPLALSPRDAGSLAAVRQSSRPLALSPRDDGSGSSWAWAIVKWLGIAAAGAAITVGGTLYWLVQSGTLDMLKAITSLELTPEEDEFLEDQYVPVRFYVNEDFPKFERHCKYAWVTTCDMLGHDPNAPLPMANVVAWRAAHGLADEPAAAVQVSARRRALGHRRAQGARARTIHPPLLCPLPNHCKHRPSSSWPRWTPTAAATFASL